MLIKPCLHFRRFFRTPPVKFPQEKKQQHCLAHSFHHRFISLALSSFTGDELRSSFSQAREVQMVIVHTAHCQILSHIHSHTVHSYRLSFVSSHSKGLSFGKLRILAGMVAVFLSFALTNSKLATGFQAVSDLRQLHTAVPSIPRPCERSGLRFKHFCHWS